MLTCKATGCSTPIRVTHLMCARHWRMVPAEIQRDVWTSYRPGQCDDGGRPSLAWIGAASRAVQAVAAVERDRAARATYSPDATQLDLLDPKRSGG